MRRRDVLAGALLLPMAGAAVRGPWEAWSQASDTSAAPQPPADAAFTADTVRARAKALAATPFKPAKVTLPKDLEKLSYDQYRMIRFRPDQALWRKDGLPFQLQFFHPGFIFTDRVDIFQVVDGKAVPVRYSPALFDFGPLQRPPPDADYGFSGFRIHGRLNRPDYFDEIGVFLGASYFRAVGRGQVYGLSARGLSINTADPRGEEFPAFKTFWIEKPNPGAASLVVHALLDSRSATAAFRFTITPGEATVYDTDMMLYPRVEVDAPGIATLTSMFYFDANDRAGIDDFRPAVHDSDGLAMQNGRGEQLWRPLANPHDLQISTFSDQDPRGFGLMQRRRAFADYQDLETHYEKRPSAWIEPLHGWGAGAVQLTEIPTKNEVHDNIIAFWRPKQPLAAKQSYPFRYRIHWGREIPTPQPLARVARTGIGAGPDDSRLIVIDFAGEALTAIAPQQLQAVVSASKSDVKDIVLRPNPEISGVRVSFRIPADTSPNELRAELKRSNVPVSEAWIYRWTQ